MFTWICPQCGREVPPSSAECPTCAERRQQQPLPPQYQQQPAPPPQPPQYAPPQQAYPPPQGYPPPQQAFPPPQGHPPPQQVYPPPQGYPPPQQVYPPPQGYPPQQEVPQQVYTIGNEKKSGMPTWLVAILTLVVIGGGLFGVYRFFGSSRGSAPLAPPPAAQQPAGSGAHPYAKHIEVVGVRMMETSDKKTAIRFAVVNHSPAELSGMEIRLTIQATNASPGDAPIAVVDAKVGTVPPHGIKDMEVPLSTKLRVYELPDWQFVKPVFEITAPK